MKKRIPIFYSAVLLTVVNLLLRLISTSFQVFLSNRIGAAGIGLVQLVLSIGSMAMTIGMAGIRTATMYLTAEEIGKKRTKNIKWVLSGCFRYSLLCSSLTGITVFILSPILASRWIGYPETAASIRLFAMFLPIVCLCGVMTGYFTAANRVGTLAVIEVAEQIFTVAVTVLVLQLWAQSDPLKACYGVILGSSLGACLTLGCLLILRWHHAEVPGSPVRIARRLQSTAIPLALADDLKSGISTVESLMVPRRLCLYTDMHTALYQFGAVCGMVFPVLMFPASILFGLTELLIPEIARCQASGSQKRIHYLVKKSIRVAFLYGTVVCGILFLSARPLCLALYRNPDIGQYLRWFAFLTPVLYCDAITDALVKGLGQQKISVRYNILTAGMDVVILYFLLPIGGMQGYFVSFLLTHGLNFFLSIRLLLKITHEKIIFRIPLSAATVTLAAIAICRSLKNTAVSTVSYLLIVFCALYLLKVLKKEDLLWLCHLIRSGRHDALAKS